jgi:hypothetical protein
MSLYSFARKTQEVSFRYYSSLNIVQGREGFAHLSLAYQVLSSAFYLTNSLISHIA